MMPRKKFGAWINPHINENIYMGESQRIMMSKNLFRGVYFGKMRTSSKKKTEKILILKG